MLVLSFGNLLDRQPFVLLLQVLPRTFLGNELGSSPKRKSRDSVRASKSSRRARRISGFDSLAFRSSTVPSVASRQAHYRQTGSSLRTYADRDARSQSLAKHADALVLASSSHAATPGDFRKAVVDRDRIKQHRPPTLGSQFARKSSRLCPQCGLILALDWAIWMSHHPCSQGPGHGEIEVVRQDVGNHRRPIVVPLHGRLRASHAGPTIQSLPHPCLHAKSQDLPHLLLIGKPLFRLVKTTHRIRHDW